MTGNRKLISHPQLMALMHQGKLYYVQEVDNDRMWLRKLHRKRTLIFIADEEQEKNKYGNDVLEGDYIFVPRKDDEKPQIIRERYGFPQLIDN